MNQLSSRIQTKTENKNHFNLTPPLPSKNMLIETNNACNHKCIFCSNRKMTRRKGNIQPDFLKRILQEAYDHGVREVGYYSTGEPFLNPDLPAHIKTAKEIGYDYVYLTSNGALATLERVKPCLEAGLDSLKFSVNGYDKETYHLIHGVDDFDRVISNIRDISSYRKERHLNFNLFSSSIFTEYTAKEKGTFQSLLAEYVDEMVFFHVGNQGGLISDVIEELSVAHEVIVRKNCALPFHSLNITHEGYLTACCVDFNNSLVVADLNQVSLLEAWHSEKMQELRRRILEDDVANTMCYNCFHNTQEEFQAFSPMWGTEFDFQRVYQDQELKQRKKERGI